MQTQVAQRQQRQLALHRRSATAKVSQIQGLDDNTLKQASKLVHDLLATNNVKTYHYLMSNQLIVDGTVDIQQVAYLFIEQQRLLRGKSHGGVNKKKMKCILFGIIVLVFVCALYITKTHMEITYMKNNCTTVQGVLDPLLHFQPRKFLNEAYKLFQMSVVPAQAAQCDIALKKQASSANNLVSSLNITNILSGVTFIVTLLSGGENVIACLGSAVLKKLGVTGDCGITCNNPTSAQDDDGGSAGGGRKKVTFTKDGKSVTRVVHTNGRGTQVVKYRDTWILLSSLTNTHKTH